MHSSTYMRPLPLPAFIPHQPGERKTMSEPSRQIPVLTEADVAVLGGGPAGVCAAVAAARSGARVVIVERYGYFGGMACAANVNVWHGLWSPDFNTKVIGGLPEEILDRLETLKAVRNRRPDGRGDFTICTESAKLVFDDVVVGSGAKIIFHGWLADVIYRDSRTIDAAIIETKSGRGAIRASVFIDCTGDGDLCARAGAPTQTGDEDGRCQPPTLCFRIAGVDASKAKAANVDNWVIQKELGKQKMDYNGAEYPCYLWGGRSVYRQDELMLAGTRVIGVNCSKHDDFTRAEVEARYQMRWVMGKLQKFPGYENISLVDIGAQIGVRETRRIHGDHEIQANELLDGRRFEDTIAQGTYPVDVHNPIGRGIKFRRLDGTSSEVTPGGEWIDGRWDGLAADAPKRTTPCYCIPYRSLIPSTLDNVLVAGRCISATHEAAGALRVMINAMSFGHAAGRAAALATTHAGNVREVDTRQLQSSLRGDGVPLLETQVKAESGLISELLTYTLCKMSAFCHSRAFPDTIGQA